VESKSNVTIGPNLHLDNTMSTPLSHSNPKFVHPDPDGNTSMNIVQKPRASPKF